MNVNYKYLSPATLIAMIEDLTSKAEQQQITITELDEDLKEEHSEADYQRRQHQEWQDKCWKLEGKYHTLKYSDEARTEEQWRKDIAYKMLEKTHGLTNDYALVICGVVSDVLKHKIPAIKEWISISGVGLKEAKDAVEQWHSRITD